MKKYHSKYHHASKCGAYFDRGSRRSLDNVNWLCSRRFAQGSPSPPDDPRTIQISLKRKLQAVQYVTATLLEEYARSPAFVSFRQLSPVYKGTGIVFESFRLT